MCRWVPMSRVLTLPSPAASRRVVLRLMTSAASALALEGCAALSETGAGLDAAELAASPTLLVATTRKPANGARAKPWFGPERASRMSVARAKLTPPDEGRFSRASVGLSDWRLDAVETVPQVADLFRQATTTRDVLVYVHGFNQTFEAAALDAARSLGRHPVSRRDFGVLLAVQGEAVRLRLRPRERHVVARCLGAGARRLSLPARRVRASISSRTASAPC